MQDGKGLLCGNFLLQIMLKMLDNSWCAETSFPKKTIPSSCFGEYKWFYVIWNHQIHILMTISCFKTLHVLQNQSFSSFAPLVCVFLVTASCKSVLNYVLKMFIIFAFCMISLPHSSRYVLIDISNLTHFLCRNTLWCCTWHYQRFPRMFWKFAYPSLKYTLLLTVNFITNTL